MVPVCYSFFEFMFNQPNSVWLAHSGARFDMVFNFNWLLEEKGVVSTNIVMSGNKIMKLGYKSCHILDSYLFFQMKLESLMKCMGLEGGIEKGFHPYRFTDIDYVSNIVDRMDEDVKKKFEKWYLSRKGMYVFKDELYYCQMDVDILRKACVKFSQWIREATQNSIFPFYDVGYMTIASLAMHVFRSCFLQKKKRLECYPLRAIGVVSIKVLWG